MPGENFYKGLTLAEKLSRFADHHYAKTNRHISIYERQMLDEVSKRLEEK